MTASKRRQDDTLFCTGFWKVAGNQKRSSAHYAALLPKTMHLLRGQRLHLFYDDQDTLAHYETEARQNGIDLTATRIALKDLPTYEDVLPILATCERLVAAGEHEKDMPAREKMARHLKRDYVLSGADAFRALLTVWTSKVSLLAELSRSAPADVARVNWVDASVAKFNGNRTNWNFLAHRPQDGRVGHYASPMLYNGEFLPLNASFLGGTREIWPTIESLFRKQLSKRAGDGYVHDEETIMSCVIAETPDLFETIGRPVRGIRRLPIKILSKFY